MKRRIGASFSYTPFEIVVVDSPEDYLATCKEYGAALQVPGKCLGNTALLDAKDDSQVCIVYFPTSPAPDTIVHESVHIFQYYCEVLGEARPSVEFEAYSIQHYFREICDVFDNSNPLN